MRSLRNSAPTSSEGSLIIVSDVFPLERAASLPGPAWLADERGAAARRFAEMELPHPSLEEWRYSRIDLVDPARFVPAPIDGPAGEVPAVAAELSVTLGEFAGRLIHHNGRLVSVELAPDVAAMGVTLGLLADLDAPLDEVSVAAATEDVFTEANRAIGTDPLVLAVPRGVTIDRPFQVIGVIVGPGPVLVLPRLVVRAGENCEFSVVEWLSSDADTEALVVPRTQLSIALAARVRLVSVNDLGAASHQLGAVVAQVGQEASVRMVHAALGGSYSRNRFDCRLVGRGASGRMSALYVGGGDQMHDLRTFQTHEAPDTDSELLFKGALDDRSHAVYTGTIRVEHEARGTNATQANRIIKLSEEAWAESVPNLEINHNDVRCAHASAVGPIDEDQRFYLESRGVPPEVAERLVVNGFFEEVLEQVGIAAVIAALRPLVSAKLGVGQ